MNRAIIIPAFFLLAGTHLGFAQPAPDNAPIAANPANTNHLPADFDKKMEGMPANMKAFMKLTPEQQREQMRQTEEKLLRSSCDRAGFKDLKLQDAVLAYVAEQEKSRSKVRTAANKVYLALEPRGNPTDKTGMALLVDNYLNAVEDEKEAREAATKALDKEIGLSDNPHLMGFLLLNGIIGDASWYTGHVILGGSMSISSLALN
jgi:hypothetical protein